MKIIILGGGLVGGPMALDLAHESKFRVTVADINPSRLEWLKKQSSIHTVACDLSQSQVLDELLPEYDLAISAVPGFLGFQTLKTIINSKTDVIDIAFFPEDPFLLDEQAKQNNVTAIVDCGVAPGMSHILVGYASQLLDTTEQICIYVGGLPKLRQWPFEYKAVFSPVDVIEEYLRPARLIEKGFVIEKPALSDPELIDFPGIGILEAFNSDGLRTLIKTIPAIEMKEKTLRYPGHIEKIRLLRDIGLFSSKTLIVNGQNIKPIDLTSQLLFPLWKLEKSDEDITVMKVSVTGQKNGQKLKHEWNLFDEYDRQTGIHSMARTTGFTATAVARLFAKGLYQDPGICPPEYLGKKENCLDFILAELEKKGIFYDHQMESLA